MRRCLLALLFVLAAAIGSGDARAQFCPGVSPWVFDDVLSSDPFCGFITKMAQQGVTLGCIVIDANHRLYCPNDSVNRKQMAAFMARLGDALLPPTCSVGQVLKWNGATWACADDNGGGGGGGTVTSVMAGTGLQGSPNPITGSGSLNLASSYQLPQACTSGQVPASNGSGGWTCATPVGTGTVTSIIAGTGLTGGTITGSGTVAADVTYLQRRVGGTCPAGSSIRVIAVDGTVTCQADTSGPPNAFVQGGNAFGANALLGTTDGNDLRLIANSRFALRLQHREDANNVNTINVIGGSPLNSVGALVVGGTIAGGGGTWVGQTSANSVLDAYGTVGGGRSNTVGGVEAVIAGGRGNIAGGPTSVVGGGHTNTSSGESAAVGGGRQNAASASWATIAGGRVNVASADYATVGGGTQNTASGAWTTIAGGRDGEATADYATVAGGLANEATGTYAFVGGGVGNTAGTNEATIAGGHLNSATGNLATIGGGTLNDATGNGSFIGGGGNNTASGSSATVAGGSQNVASGSYSFTAGLFNAAEGTRSVALGFRAKAQHDGTFVFADYNNFDFGTNSANTFRVRATGGVRFVVDIDGTGNTAWSCALFAGGSWSCSSDRNQKQDFVQLDGIAVLDKVAAMPLYAWSPKGRNSHVRHYGPTAQDFHAAFGLGESDLAIGQQDADGVALAAIQGLNAKLEQALAARDAQVAAQERELAELRGMIQMLAARMSMPDSVAAAR